MTSLSRIPRLPIKPNLQTRNQFVLVFKHGCVVFWECQTEIRLKLEQFLSKCELEPFSELDRLTSEYSLVVNKSLVKPQIKNDCIYLVQHNLHEKIMMSYGLIQDLILCRTTLNLNSVVRHSKGLAQYMYQGHSKDLDYGMLVRNIGKVFVMRDAFALTRGVLDCPKYSFYKGHLSSYDLVSK
jgi:uncharacterized Rmd1/YagE family protein